MFKHLKAQSFTSKRPQEMPGHTRNGSLGNHGALPQTKIKSPRNKAGFLPQVSKTVTSPMSMAHRTVGLPDHPTALTSALIPAPEPIDQQRTFKAIQLKKHDLKLDHRREMQASISSISAVSRNPDTANTANRRQRRHRESLRGKSKVVVGDQQFLASGGNSSVDSQEENQERRSQTHRRSAKGHKQNLSQLPSYYNHQGTLQADIRGFNTSIPMTASDAIKHQNEQQQQHDPMRVTAKNGISARNDSLNRKPVKVEQYQGQFSQVDSADGRCMSMDQESSSYTDNRSQMVMTGIFDPKINIKSGQMVATHGSVFPVLQEHLNGKDSLAKKGLLTTNHSLFSKHSKSVVTQEDQLIQDITTTQSVQRVQHLLKPPQGFAQVSLERSRIQQRVTRDKRPVPMALRRTSSALHTKFSRKFRSNMQVRVTSLPTTKPSIIKHAQMRNIQNSTSPILPRDVKQALAREKNDSIFTIGEQEDSKLGLVDNSQLGHERSLSNSNGHLNMTSEVQIAGGPSYRDPIQAQRKPSKVVNRKEISRAFEAMRKNQLKQSRLNRQNVTRVCEDLMQVDQCKRDEKLEQFGRHYLRKLYSLEREDQKVQGMTPAQQLMSQTLKSFSMKGDQSGGNQFPYKGRIGAKGFSVQQSPTRSTQFAMGAVLPGIMMPSQHMVNQRNNDLANLSVHDSAHKHQQESVLTSQGFENFPDDDSLMQELLELQQDPTQRQIVVTLDGDLGNSFIQYLASETAQNLARNAPIGLPENGIQGVAKPIISSKDRHQKLQKSARKADQNTALKLRANLPQDQSPRVDTTGDHQVNDISTPPETAQEVTSLSNDQTVLNTQGRVETGYEGQEPTNALIGVTLEYDQFYEHASGHEASDQVRESRLNTSHIETSYGKPFGEAAIDSKTQRGQMLENGRKQKNQGLKPAEMFDRKALMNAMHQNVELFESFGGAVKDQKFGYRSYENDGHSPPPAKRGQPEDHRKKMEAQARESFERKVVPLNANQAFQNTIKSDLTSRDGDFVGDNSEPPTKLDNPVPAEISRVSLVEENPSKGESIVNDLIQSAGKIHSPQIKTSQRKESQSKEKQAQPIDITMTNLAIDQVYDQAQSHSFIKRPSPSPPNIKSTQDRGKGTQALLQRAQLDPNSFLHTQPIHFDNYHIHARPLDKTIYSSQYKKAQEKRAKLKERLQKLSVEKKSYRQDSESPRPANNNFNSEKSRSMRSVEIIKGEAAYLHAEEQFNIQPMSVDQTYSVNSRKDSVEASTKMQERQQTTSPGEAALITIAFIKKDHLRSLASRQKDQNSDTLQMGQGRLGTSGTLGDAVQQNDDVFRASEMTNKDERQHQVTSLNSQQPSPMFTQHAQIVTEVQTSRTKANPTGKTPSGSPAKKKSALKGKPVQNVQMEDLLLNGLSQHVENLPTENPLKTERFVAKFKGKQPIGTSAPNFLNRKRPVKKSGAATPGETMDSLKPLAPKAADSSRVKSPGFSNQILIGNQKELNIVAMGQKKQTTQARLPQRQVGATPLISDLTPTPLSNNIAEATYKLHMIKANTLHNDQARALAQVTRLQPDIQAALAVAQSYNTENVINTQTTQGLLQSLRGATGNTQIQLGGQPTNKLAIVSHIVNTDLNKVFQSNTLETKQTPSALSAEQEQSMRHLVTKGHFDKRVEGDGAQTRIKHHRPNDDLMAVKQSAKAMEGVSRQRPGFVSAEISLLQNAEASGSAGQMKINQALEMPQKDLLGRLNDPSQATDLLHKHTSEGVSETLGRNSEIETRKD